MKGGKDEEKLMGPLFPPLHIKDAERGGPKARPRNKMALYEQVSIPSQRLTSGSASMSPLPSQNRGSSSPSTSSGCGGGQKRRLCSVICNSPTSSHLAERHHSYFSSGMNMNTTLMNLEWQPMELTKYMPMTANCSLLQTHSIPNSKNSSAKEELADEIIFEVSTFVQSGRTPNCSTNGQPNTDKEKPTDLIPNRQIRTARVRPLKQTSSEDLTSTWPTRYDTEKNSIVSLSCHDRTKGIASILTNGDEVLEDALVKGARLTSDEEKRSNLVDDSSRSVYDSNAQLRHECKASKETNNAPRYGVSAEPKRAVGMRNASMLEGASSFRTPPRDDYRSCIGLENVGECHEDPCGPFQVGELDGNGDISDKSIVDSTSGVHVMPDDIIRVMGQKQFLKARKAILHQQRVFAGQVFELHRLMKVQRLFASSRDLLLESDRFYRRKSSIAAKKLPTENALEVPPPLIVKQKDAAENALGKPPFPSLRCAATNTKPNNTQQSNSKLWSSNPPPPPPPPPPPTCCFHPQPRNHWLVPVMSPFEGLIYKPYNLPCPPTSNFMVPVYGSCEPTNPIPKNGGFLNSAYGILSGALPLLGQTYFPPHGTLLMDPSARTRSNEQENHLMMEGIKFPMPCKSSCYESTGKSKLSRVNSYCVGVGNSRVSKECEDLGSNTSSPSERVQGDALPLFPMDPMKVHISDQIVQTRDTEQWNGAIKVVPYNPRSASESAARIFQSIQEERRLYS